jgi:outer membrane protein assembly factor BamA
MILLFIKNKFSKIITLLLFLLLNNVVNAQASLDSVSKCPIVSVPDLFKKTFMKKDTVDKPKPVKNSFFLLIPVIGSQPATGFMYGAVAQYTFKGDKPIDKYSSIGVSLTYTTKNQLLFSVKNNVFLKENSIFLSSDYRIYKFSQSNYGLGTNIIPPKYDGTFDIDSIAQPMEYDYFRFYQTASWEVKDNFYVGFGVALDWYEKINDENLDVDTGQYTYHYNYSQQYGYSDTSYFINGVSLNLLYDSRDNQINANHGWYGNLNYRLNPSLNDNQKVSHVLFAEGRYFIPLSKTNIQHVLGFWIYGQYLMHGSVPYLNMPAIGWDQRSRSGKGYTQGLFRGFNIMYFETEYRFPISCNQLISGTVYTNFTSTSDKDTGVKLLEYIQPAVGVGLRFLIDKRTRTNIILNQAWGRDSKAFYLNAGETF